MTAWVEILFPLFELRDPSTKAFFVDGGSNQAWTPVFGSGGTVAPGALPHQIGTDVLGPRILPGDIREADMSAQATQSVAQDFTAKGVRFDGFTALSGFPAGASDPFQQYVFSIWVPQADIQDGTWRRPQSTTGFLSAPFIAKGTGTPNCVAPNLASTTVRGWNFSCDPKNGCLTGGDEAVWSTSTGGGNNLGIWPTDQTWVNVLMSARMVKVTGQYTTQGFPGITWTHHWEGQLYVNETQIFANANITSGQFELWASADSDNLFSPQDGRVLQFGGTFEAYVQQPYAVDDQGRVDSYAMLSTNTPPGLYTGPDGGGVYTSTAPRGTWGGQPDNYVTTIGPTGELSGGASDHPITLRWSIGGEPDRITHSGLYGLGTGAAVGCVSELYYAPGQWLDLTNKANRDKFHVDNGSGIYVPTSLGGDGSTPTGTKPLIYLSGDYTQFHLNRADGNNPLTVTGALLPCEFDVPPDPSGPF